ncbi:MAG: FtsX-like permease family protein [Bacteroidota bacterium]
MLLFSTRSALRSLRHDMGYAALNGIGLVVALAACILIALFVRDQLSYDRHHAHADRIVVLGRQNTAFGQEEPTPSTPYAIGDALKDGVAGVEEVVRMTYGSPTEGVVLVGDTPDDWYETGGFAADPSFFRVFTSPVVAGDGRDPLADPSGIVLTEPVAEHVFGSAENAVGKGRRVIVGGDTLDLTVRAVVERPPSQSSIQYGALISTGALLGTSPSLPADWRSVRYRTFVLLRPGVPSATIEVAANRLSQAEMGNGTEDDGIQYVTLPLAELHLSSLSYKQGFKGSLSFIRIFASVAFLILLISVINYVNMSTARATRRAREVGVRKALGASRNELMSQFLRESIALTALSAVGGVVAATLALPWFNETFGVRLSLASLDSLFWAGLGGATLAVGVLAGLYPSAYLSRFSPSRVLAGGQTGGAGATLSLGGTRLRRGLVVVQFATAVALVALTGSVAHQLNYMRSASLGFEPDGLVSVHVDDPLLAGQTETLKAAFEASPSVLASAGASDAPPNFWGTSVGQPDPDQPDLQLFYNPVDADAGLADVLGLDVKAGRWFEAGDASEAPSTTVITEGFARALGYAPEEVIDKTLDIDMREGQRVIGVVGDFHHASLRDPIQPVAFRPNQPASWEEPGTPVRYREIVVRMAPGRDAEALAHLQAAWAQFSPETPIRTTRIADKVADLNREESALARVFGLFALIAVVIAALGLAGLAAYSAKRRQREIGIRKVLGATVGGLVGLLSREYLVLATVSAALALPIVIVIVRRWLEGFAFHAPISLAVLVGAVTVVLLVALASVGTQALRAASASPTRTLRSE